MLQFPPSYLQVREPWLQFMDWTFAYIDRGNVERARVGLFTKFCRGRQTMWSPAAVQ